MGSAPSVQCCQPQESSAELSSMVPSKIYAVAVVQQNYQIVKDAACSTSFLSEIDFYISKLKQDQSYRNQFMQLFPSFEDLLDNISYQLTSQWVVPIQSKTYDIALIRFNTLTNIVMPIEFGLIERNAGNTDAIFSRGNLKKASFLLLEKQFKAYKEEEYLQLMMTSLKQWKGIQDAFWVLDPQQTYSDMRRHLLYHWNHIVGSINSELSLNDAVSWTQARFLFNFCLHFLANEPLEIIQKAYTIDNWIYEAEAMLLTPGQSITFFGFVKLTPYVEQKGDYEEDEVRFSPPKGDEQVPHVKIKFIVIPLKQTAFKFRSNQYLYYLPLTTFSIQNMQHKYGQIYVYLKEQYTQELINYLSKNTLPQMTANKVSKKEQDRMVNELSNLRESISKQIQRKSQINKTQQCCQDYYKKYVKGRVARLTEHQIPTLSKKQLEICEDDVKIALDQQPTLEQAQSQPRWITVTQQETAKLQKDLTRYIQRLQFQKLQSQIDKADRFINIISLNISQCWLQKLQCLHCFPNLVQLFAYSNMIKKIEGLEKNENLRLLSLARNEIQVLENMNQLVHLRQLYLTKNKLELASAVYLSGLNLAKLKLLTISFKQRPDQCFEALLQRPPAKLKQLVINEGDQLAQRTKNTIKRRLKGVQIQYIHN